MTETSNFLDSNGESIFLGEAYLYLHLRVGLAKGSTAGGMGEGVTAIRHERGHSNASCLDGREQGVLLESEPSLGTGFVLHQMTMFSSLENLLMSRPGLFNGEIPTQRDDHCAGQVSSFY
jgi:hypothetical protein